MVSEVEVNNEVGSTAFGEVEKCKVEVVRLVRLAWVKTIRLRLKLALRLRLRWQQEVTQWLNPEVHDSDSNICQALKLQSCFINQTLVVQ